MHLIIPVVTSKGKAHSGPVLEKWVPVPASSGKAIEVKCNNYSGMGFSLTLDQELALK